MQRWCWVADAEVPKKPETPKWTSVIGVRKAVRCDLSVVKAEVTAATEATMAVISLVSHAHVVPATSGKLAAAEVECRKVKRDMKVLKTNSLAPTSWEFSDGVWSFIRPPMISMKNT